MKKVLYAVAIAATVGLSGCAMVASPVFASVYTKVKAPLTATSNTLGNKVGTAKAKSILGIVALGNSSIAEAAKNGHITKISHVDYEAKNILGFYATYTVYVYGE